RAFLDAMPDGYARAFPPEELAHHHGLLTAGAPTIGGAGAADDRWRCTVVAPDRTGLLAPAAGALALVGIDIDTAAAYLHPDGIALAVFTGRHRFDRLRTDEGRTAATATLAEALAGAIALDAQL